MYSSQGEVVTKITDNGVVDVRPMHVKSLKEEETAEMRWQVQIPFNLDSMGFRLDSIGFRLDTYYRA